MNKQLIKDLGRLLNDTRIGFGDVRRDVYRGGIVIGCVSFAYGDGNYCTLARDVHVTYNNIIDVVRALYAAHPVRDMADVLYSIKYDTGRDTLSMGVTYSSNLELINVKHSRVSRLLRWAFDAALDKDDVTYKTQYVDKYISEFNKAGGFTVTL